MRFLITLLIAFISWLIWSWIGVALATCLTLLVFLLLPKKQVSNNPKISKLDLRNDNEASKIPQGPLFSEKVSVDKEKNSTEEEFNPDSSDYSCRAFMQAQIYGDHNAGLNDVTKAIELDPMNTSAYLIRSQIKEDLQDYKGAYKDASVALLLEPSNEQAKFQCEKLEVFFSDRIK